MGFMFLTANFLSFLLAVLVIIFLKLPSLAGVILLTSTIIFSSFLDRKKGLLLGIINSILATLLMIFYFKVTQKPFTLSQFFSTLPFFLICGYFAGKYNELRIATKERLEKKIQEKTRELQEKTRELKDSKKVLEIRIKAKTRQLREIVEEQKELIKQKTRELQERVKDLEKTRAALINILEDVGEERKKAEEERSKTLVIIENFVDGLLVFDKEKNLILLNPKAEDFLKIKKEKILGKNFADFKRIKELEFLYKILEEDLKPVFRKEAKITKDFILEVTCQPIFREKEKIGNLILLHDISREKLIERMKTEFVSIAAHQLRTPLSAIKWTLKMLLDGDLGPLSKDQKEFIKKTYSSNERMIRLINDLLKVTRIEEGRFIYTPTLTNLGRIIQNIIDSYRELLKNKKLELEFKKPKKLPKIRVDVEKMSLAIQNLIDNAIRYTLPGGKIKISLKNLGKEIEFSIQDTGIGIPKSQQERIFTKFFRGYNAIKAETEGSGLGLFITKNIIESHGGKIWFKSEEGKGTTFYFRLPLKYFDLGNKRW
jgi:two-component system phosphate regulon sensor histidine kinase PhoR